MGEKAALYDESGRVKDVSIAHSMAKVEDPFRSEKRMWGLLGPSKKTIARGEKEAEQVGERLVKIRSMLKKRQESDGGVRDITSVIEPWKMTEVQFIDFLQKALKPRYESIGDLEEEVAEINEHVLFGDKRREEFDHAKKFLLDSSKTVLPYRLLQFDLKDGSAAVITKVVRKGGPFNDNYGILKVWHLPGGKAKK